jgi:hypothetical protein
MTLCGWGLFLTTNAQRYPASANAVIVPPNSVYYHDYFSSGNDMVQLTLLFNDFNEVSRDVYLRFSMEGNGIAIKSKEGFVPIQTFTLIPGTPTIVTSSDMSEFSDTANLDFSGVSNDFLNSNGRLGEGLYTFCFEIIDLESGKVLSNKSCSNAWVILKDPPFMISPINEINIPVSEPLNIPFQWQLNNIGTPDGIYTTEYQLTLFEIEDLSSDPIVAINNGHALQIFQSNWQQQTQFIFDLSAAQLDLGHTYAYYVQARNTDGLEDYKNNGISEISSFMYGYNQGGEIELVGPANNSSFKLNAVQNLSWESPDNLTFGQQFVYYLKIVEATNDEDPAEALANNPIWYDFTSPTYASAIGANILLGQPLEENQRYVWQVEAHSGEQVTARSEIFTFRGPPFIEEFKAGDHVVTVTSTQNEDLTSLNGTGTLSISEDGAEIIEVDFQHLNIIEAGGLYFMTEGIIEYKFEQIKEIKIIAENERNGEATFMGNALRIDKDYMQIKGHVQWPFSHPVNSPDQAFVRSQDTWVNYDKFTPKGVVSLSDDNSFELLDPVGYQLELKDNSIFKIDYNSFSVSLNGDIILPDSLVIGETAQEVSLPFQLADQLFYFESTPDQLPNNISVASNTGILLEPTAITFDFDESQSPEKKKGTPLWKGLYFDHFIIQLTSAIDGSSQLEFSDNLSKNFDLNAFNSNQSWIDANGITLSIVYKFLEEREATFNSFPTSLKELAINVVDGTMSNSNLKGAIKLPVIDVDKQFTYTMPLTDVGFMEGYLDQALNDSQFIYNPYGQENKMNMTILRAVFRDNERLDMTLDIEIPYINATLPVVNGFNLYGDYSIGFGAKNGAITLDNQVEASYETFPMIIDEIGASLTAGRYTFSYGATMSLGDEVDGQEGPPRVTFHSISAPNEDLPTSSNPAAISPPIGANGEVSADAKVLAMDSIQINVETSIATMSGYLSMTKNDPDWGASLQGGIDGNLKIPADVAIGAHMTLGNKDDVKYWYFDAYFVDDGAGVNVFNMFNLVGFEGRVYRHMSMDVLNEDAAAHPVINPDIDFGAGLYMQMIDQGGGQTFMVDLGAEVVVSNEGFVIQMEGDISAINDGARDMNAAARLKESVAASVAEATADAAVQLLEDINLEIPIDGKTLQVTVQQDGGSLGYTDGDFSTRLYGGVSETPHVGISMQSGAKHFTLEGNVDAKASLAIEEGDNLLNLGIEGSGKGQFDFAHDGFAFTAAVDIEEQSTGFKTELDQNGVDFLVNKTEQYGKLALKGSGWNTSLELEEGTGTADLTFDDYDIQVSANKAGTLGSIVIGTPIFDLTTALDIEEKSGLLDMTEGNNNFHLSGNEDGGELTANIGSVEYFTSLDRDEQQGMLSLGYGDDKTMRIEGSSQGQALLSFAYEGTSIELNADKPNELFNFDFDHDEIGKVRLSYDGQTQQQLLGIQHGNDSISVYNASDSTAIFVAGDNTSFGIGMVNERKFIDMASNNYQASLVKYNAGGGSVLVANGDARNLLVDVNKVENSRTAQLTYDQMALKVTDHQIAVDYHTNTVQVTSDRQITFNIDGRVIEFTYDPSLEDRVNITDAGMALQYHINNLNKVAETIEIGDIVLSFEIDRGNSYSAFYSQGELEMGFSFSETGEASVIFDGFDQYIAASKASDGFSLYLADFGVSYTQDGPFVLSSKDLSLDLNGDDRVALGNSGFHFGEGNALIYEDGSSPKITLSATELSIVKGLHSFSASGENMAYNNNTFSFILDDSSAKIQEGDRAATIHYVDEAQGFELSNGSKSLQFNSDQVKYQDGEDFFAIGGEHNIEVQYDEKTVAIDPGYVALSIEDKKMAFGGDNYIELSSGDTKIAVTKQKEVSVLHDDLALDLSADQALSVVQGEHTIVLGETGRPLQYTNANNDLATGLISDAGRLGVSLGYQDYAVELSTHKFTNATLSFGSEFGDISITGGADSDLGVAFERGNRLIEAATGAGGITYTDSSEPPAIEVVQVGTETPPTVGPQYIGKITDGASGRILGNASFYYNSVDKHFIANGSVSATAGPCLTGSFAIEASPETWSIDIGSEEERIEVYPTCTGFGGGGWLNLTPDNLKIGVFAGFQAQSSVKLDWGVGYAKIWAAVEAELGAKAEMDLTPVFVVNEVGVWVHLYAGLGVEYDIASVTGDMTIAEAELQGILVLNFEEGTNVAGELSGRITILGISGNFDLEFDEDL